MAWARRSASLAISRCPPRFRQRHDRDHPLALSRPSRHAVVSWEALARLPGSSLTRVFWTCPARESTAGPCSPRPPSGRSRAARPEPRRRVPREGPHEALIGRAAVPRGAAGGRTATAAVADHGRPEASRALSCVAPDWYDPWGQRGPLWRAGPAYGIRASVSMNVYVSYTHATSPSTTTVAMA
jgi:hypothetical protein